MGRCCYCEQALPVANYECSDPFKSKGQRLRLGTGRSCLSGLNEEERDRLLERLRLARELVGSIDALDHFLQWRSPEER